MAVAVRREGEGGEKGREEGGVEGDEGIRND